MNEFLRQRRQIFAVAVAATYSASAQMLEEAHTVRERGDYTTASRVFKDLAEEGNVEAQFHLGFM